jgi:radical SAM protein with 4Fe4S-binding SPASM domain
MSLTVLPESSIADFALRVRSRGRIPIEGTLETTYRCNLRCVHCYVNEAVGDASEAAREVPTRRLLELIDEIAERGTLFLLLTGGEVLVRPDFSELYLHALRRGLLVVVYTNGTLITERIADLFADHKPQLVEITLYGMTRETYEKVTQVPGSYDKCIAGIGRLVARGVPLKLKTMALAWNQHEVASMHEYATSLGLPFIFDGLLNPRVDCGANRNGELQLSAEQLVELDLADPERMPDLRLFLERFARPNIGRAPAEQVYQCGAGEVGYTIDPYGQLQLCNLSRKRSFSLREASFSEGWDVHLPRFRSQTWRSNSVCRSCNLSALCASCPGANELESGDVEKLVPQFCENTHRRVHALMGEGLGHREDASCCLGETSGRAVPVEAQPGCGSSCSEKAADATPLIQIQRRTRPPAA